MSVDVPPLSPRQRQAVAVILAGGTAQQASDAAGVTRRTLSRWRREPAFSTAYATGAREVAAMARADVLAATGEAVAALRDGLTTGSPATRVRAARAILEIALRVAEDDTMQRLDELERRMTAWQQGPGARLTLA